MMQARGGARLPCESTNCLNKRLMMSLAACPQVEMDAMIKDREEKAAKKADAKSRTSILTDNHVPTVNSSAPGGGADGTRAATGGVGGPVMANAV